MQILRTSEAGFAEAFAKAVEDRRESGSDVAGDVTAILREVKTRGDDALEELTAKFDSHRLDHDSDWQVSAETCAAAYDAIDADLREALELAASRIRTFHEGQLPAARDTTDAIGMRLGSRWSAVEAAGLYVPGGRAAYPSSLLMNAIPAKTAGVERLVVTTPTPNGAVNPLVLAAAHIAGVDEIWRIGGAQAVAALAYGTQRIGRVDVVTGPGNAWVAEAKRQLYGVVGIDMVAGPSEILVIADSQNNPHWIAADLLSQAEHDPSSQSILITDDAPFAEAVGAAAEQQLEQLDTAKTAQRSWDDHALFIIADSLNEAPALADALAAEHVELAVDDPEAMFGQIRHAGSVFLGRSTPEAVGDYIAGPNHVLPTGRRARFSSGLSVLDFMKRTSFIGANDAALAAIGPAAVRLAEAEGLPAHARSIAMRLDKQGNTK